MVFKFKLDTNKTEKKLIRLVWAGSIEPALIIHASKEWINVGIVLFIMVKGMSALVNVLILGNKGTFENKRVNNIYEYGVYGSIGRKIEKAEADVVAAKKEYDQATANLKELLDKRDAIRKEEILSAVVKKVGGHMRKS